MKHAFSSLVVLSVLLTGCASSPLVDPVDAEQLYVPGYTVSDRDLVQGIVSTDRAGYRVIHSGENWEIEYDALYSPKGNVLMVLSGAGELGEISGYKIEYGENGLVREVIKTRSLGFALEKGERDYFDELEKDRVRTLRRWYGDPDIDETCFPILRDESGTILRVGDLYVHNDCKAYCSIEEWGPFYASDMEGGILAFQVLMENQNKAGRSTVDYLYVDGKLVAEQAFWNGTPIKTLYYDSYGRFHGIYEERDVDVMKEAFGHYFTDAPCPWYLDRK